mgnify:CR=1 FL=1
MNLWCRMAHVKRYNNSKGVIFYLQEYLKDKESDCYLTSNLYVVSEVTKLQRGLDRIGSKYEFKNNF